VRSEEEETTRAREGGRREGRDAKKEQSRKVCTNGVAFCVCGGSDRLFFVVDVRPSVRPSPDCPVRLPEVLFPGDNYHLVVSSTSD
jgi:hypothetical protein